MNMLKSVMLAVVALTFSACANPYGRRVDLPKDNDYPGGLAVIERFEPYYPREALLSGISGYVVLEFTVTEEGTVKDIVVVTASPPAIFDKAATRALSQWKFRPYMADGKPMAQRATQRINFELQNRAGFSPESA